MGERNPAAVSGSVGAVSLFAFRCAWYSAKRRVSGAPPHGWRVLPLRVGALVGRCHSPKLVELFETVNASPELLDALRSPNARRLLKGEKTWKELAELLKVAAAATAETPPATNPSPSPEEELPKAT